MNEADQLSGLNPDVGELYQKLLAAEHELEHNQCSAEESNRMYLWVKEKGIALGHSDLVFDSCEYLGVEPTRKELERTLYNSFHKRGRSDDAQTSTGYLFDLLHEDGRAAKCRDVMKLSASKRQKVYDSLIGGGDVLELEVKGNVHPAIKQTYSQLFNLEPEFLLNCYKFGKVVSCLQPSGVSIENEFSVIGRIYQDFFGKDFEDIVFTKETAEGHKSRINYHAVFGEAKQKLNYQIIIEKFKIYQLLTGSPQVAEEE